MSFKEKEFEKILREKLSEVKQSPSADVWARLANSLEDIGREKQLGNDTEQREKIGNRSREIEIRRPVRQKINWRYAVVSVAAVALLGLIITTINRAPEQSDLAQIEISKNGDLERMLEIYSSENEVVKEDSAQVTVESIARMDAEQSQEYVSKSGGKAIAQKTEHRQESVARGSDGVQSRDMSAEQQVSEEIVEVEQFAIQTDTPAVDEEVEIVKTDEPQAVRSSVGGDKDKTSDKSEYWSNSSVSHATTSKRGNPLKQKSTLLSTSLYAGNLGLNSEVSNRHKGDLMAISLGESGFEMSKVQNWSNILNVFKDEALTMNNEKHRLPISVGMSVSIGLKDNLSIETGLLYSYLNSEWKLSRGGRAEYKVSQSLHYLGIPIRLKYDFLNRKLFKLYVSGGGLIERGISGKQTIKAEGGSQSVDRLNNVTTQKVKYKGFQFSVGGNIGVELKLSRDWGLYVEPGVNYYFENNQPVNYRTENPVSFNLRAGIRVNF